MDKIRNHKHDGVLLNSIVNIGDYMAYNIFKTSKIYNLI